MTSNRTSLDKVLRRYFGASLAEITNAPECSGRRGQIEPFFRQQLASTLDDVARDDSFIAHLFHVVLGYNLTVGEPLAHNERRQLVDYVLGLWQNGGGFLSVHRAPSTPRLFSGTPERTDIYATAYALAAMELLGEPVSPAIVGDVLRWLFSQRAPSGWFYQRTLGDTMEERKFQNELTLQTLSALLVLNSYGELDPQALGTTREILDRALPSLRYMGVLYQALHSLSLLGDSAIPPEGAQTAFDFVNRHYDAASGGFFEYLFAETKIDEIAGQTQRFQHDYLQPTITAGYRALQVLRLLGESTQTRDWWAGQRDRVWRYFIDLPPSIEGGFGSRLQIARFPTPFGPLTTPLETLMVACAPGLLLALDRSFL